MELKIIAESGSTKTDWVVLHNNSVLLEVQTKGLNPYFVESRDVLNIVNNELICQLNEIDSVSNIFFYGSGCGNSDGAKIIANNLKNLFVNSKIEVSTDLIGAARSLCQHDKGVVCILGTGSNSCYYDGNAIVDNLPSLGYIFGDEGSGAFIGKTLITAYLNNTLPKSIIQDLNQEFSLSKESILMNVYKKPRPNAYLASFVPFVYNRIGVFEMELLVIDCFKGFFEKQILYYRKYGELPVYFTGSVAYYFSKIIIKLAESYSIKIGNISKTPMDGLIKYHNS